METQLKAALRRLQGVPLADRIDLGWTVLVFLDLIIQNPSDKKYRKIRRSNCDFVDRIGRIPGGEDVLEAVGFLQDGDFLVMESSLHLQEQYTLRRLRDMICEFAQHALEQFDALPRLHDDHSWVCVKGAGMFDDIGARSTMEDDHILVDQFGPNGDMAFFGLYDGHGGREAVEFVVRSLHLNMINLLEDCRSIPDEIEEIWEKTYELTDDQIRRMVMCS